MSDVFGVEKISIDKSPKNKLSDTNCIRFLSLRVRKKPTRTIPIPTGKDGKERTLSDTRIFMSVTKAAS